MILQTRVGTGEIGENEFYIETTSFDKELKHSSIAYRKHRDRSFQFTTANHKLQFSAYAV